MATSYQHANAFQSIVDKTKNFLLYLHDELVGNGMAGTHPRSSASSDECSVDLLRDAGDISRAGKTRLPFVHSAASLIDDTTAPRFPIHEGRMIQPAGHIDQAHYESNTIVSSSTGETVDNMRVQKLPGCLNIARPAHNPTTTIELFLSPLDIAKSSCTILHALKPDVARIKAKSHELPLRDFLNLIQVEYRLDRFFPKRHRHADDLYTHGSALPQDIYHDLVELEAAYDAKHLFIQDKSVRELIVAIRGTLTWHRKTIEHNLRELEDRCKSRQLRDFVSWVYRRYNVKSNAAWFDIDINAPRNPHAIYWDNRILKEAIRHYGSAKFVNDRGTLCIYAKQIVYLLKGGKDWRIGMCPGDRLVSHHPAPAQVLRVG